MAGCGVVLPAKLSISAPDGPDVRSAPLRIWVWAGDPMEYGPDGLQCVYPCLSGGRSP